MKRIAIGVLVCGVLVAAVAGHHLATRRIRAFAPSDLPAIPVGLAFDEAATAAFVAKADAATRNGLPGGYRWEHCFARAAVLRMPMPDGAGYAWRDRAVDAMTLPGWKRYERKDFSTVVLDGMTPNLHFEVMPFEDDMHPSDFEPFEIELVSSDPRTLFVLALSGECPDPNPRWKQIARTALGWLGVR